MQIQYCSDLHLEFPTNAQYMQKNPIKPLGEILLLAGDIVPFTRIDDHKKFFDAIADNFQHTYWIPGNHEYYYSDITERTATFSESIRSNVTLLNNTTIQHKDIRLIFSTLWSKIDPRHELVILKLMADFRLITNNGRRLTAENYNALHEICKTFLTNELTTPTDKKTIVVSHHLPTFKNYPEKYRFSQLNSGFAVELSDLIEPSNADYWIAGHTHEIVPDFKIGNTTITTNQLGYVERREHSSYGNRVLTIGE